MFRLHVSGHSFADLASLVSFVNLSRRFTISLLLLYDFCNRCLLTNNVDEAISRDTWLRRVKLAERLRRSAFVFIDLRWFIPAQRYRNA